MLKIVLDFVSPASRPTGWSEVYYNQATTIADFIGPVGSRWQPGSKANAIVEQRRACLSRLCYMGRIRVTDLDPTHKGSLSYEIPPNQRQGLFLDKGIADMAEVWTCLLVKLFSASRRPRNLYLGGIPELIVSQPNSYSADAAFTGVLTNFFALLTTSYTWPARKPVGLPDVGITDFTPGVSARTAVMKPLKRPVANPASWYVLIRGMTNPRGWNGIHRAVVGSDPTTMLIGPTRKSMVTEPAYVLDPKATVSIYEPDDNKIDECRAIKLVSRKRGRPFNVPRGRR